MPPFIRSLGVFLAVGSVGFIVDGGLLTILSSTMELDIYLSRCISFTFASFITWLFNRWHTFKNEASISTQKSAFQYARYVIIQICGALINLAVFMILVTCSPPLRLTPLIPLFIGAVVAFFFNFFGARLWVFKK